MELTVRRIVTGHDAEGRSVVVEDKTVPVERRLNELWVTDTMPARYGGTPNLGPLPTDLEPPKQGTVLRFVRFEPTEHLSGEALERHFAEAFATAQATHARVDTSRHPAMHKTTSLDYGIVLSGRITLLLDEEERELKPFDVVIQRGTNHGWVNRGDEPALMAFVLIDGDGTE